MTHTGKLSRRRLLLGLTGAAGAAILAACGDEVAPTATTGAGAAATGASNPFGGTPTRPAGATTAATAATTGGATTAATAATTGGATTAATAATTSGATAAATAATTGGATMAAPAVNPGTGKMTYWGGLIFSDEANMLQVNAIKDWGKQNKIDIDVVMINQNETNMKVAAAVEAKTMPDAFDLGLDLLLLLTNQNQLLDLGSTYTKIGTAGGGWLKSVESALDPKNFGGQRAAIPYGTGGNVLFRRADVLMKAGITTAPKTWNEVGDAAVKTNKPPLYGMGFALSNVGDGNVQVQVLQSWGGRIADDTGKMVTLKSPETKAYLQWVTDLYKQGVFPPGVTTWDGAGDNTAYLSGQAVFIANTGSVTIAAKANKDDDLVKNTQYSAMPAGPKMRVSPGSPVLRAIPKTSKNPDAAKALLEYLATPAFTAKYYPLAIYGPVLMNETSQDIFKNDAVHQGLADLGVNGTAPAFPDVSNTAYADFNNNFLVPKMIQRVVIDKYDLDKAIDEAQKAGEMIYAKYK